MNENDASPHEAQGSLLGSGRWKIDPKDSVAEFAVKTFWGLVTVRGIFKEIDGWLEAGSDGPDRVQGELKIAAASLDTGNSKRDKHLRSADFFAVEDHPAVKVEVAQLSEVSAGKVRVVGGLQAAGEVTPLELEGTVSADGGGLSIEGETIVDRTLLGMTWSPLGMVKKEAKLHVRASLVPA